MVRVNPIHEHSDDKIRRAIAAGAEIIMLPMFCYPWEVSKFIEIIGGKAKTCLLFETGAALANIH
jgi:citrate lyase beta subunit